MNRLLLCIVMSFAAGGLYPPSLAAQPEPPADDHAHADGENHAHEDAAAQPHEDEHEVQHEEEREEGEAGHNDAHGDDHNEPALTLTEARLAEFGARVAIAQAGVIREQVTLPGEVQLNQEAVAHIAPRFPAKVVKVLARTGDRVSAGQVLAIAENSDTLTRFELTSLIEGTVINRHITLGEMLGTSDTAFVVADLSTLWVDIDLYPKHIPKVRPGQAVRIATQHGPPPAEARIDYVAPRVDENTRTGLARVFLPNAQGQWKPGTFVTATITLDEQPATVVAPKTAVIDLEDRKVIFVREGERWEPRPVALGRDDATRVEVREGLRAGERYVADGGFILKAQLQKGEFESGHNH